MAPRQSRPPRSPQPPQPDSRPEGERDRPLERDIAPLPAPYEAPWRRLAADLQAVLAGVGLKLRELARLNGEGRLSRPGFWSAELAPLFWPLALALGAALLVGLLVAGQAALARRQPAAVADAAASSSLENRAAEPSPSVPPGGLAPRGSAPERLAPESPEDAQASTAPDPRAPSAPAPAEPAAAESSAGAPDGPVPPTPAERLTDLRRDLLGPEPPLWVGDIEEQPAAALLQLRVGPEFAGLPEPQRRALAEQWLERARQRGYERLELLDPAGAVLARPARVGSGMILLDSLPPSP